MSTASAVVPVGYKQTEVGVIPEDWYVKTFSDVGEVRMCRRIFNHETKSSGEVPFFKIGTFGKTPNAFISKEKFDSYRTKFSFPKKGSILISAAGTIGRTIVYDGEDAYFQDSNIIWIKNNEDLISNQFLNHVLDVARYTTEGGTIQRLYNSILLKTKFKCPPKLEQRVISEILDDINCQINGFIRLTAKLRDIKNSVMLKLLTGTTRLPGFDGTWESIRLGNLVKIDRGQLITQSETVHGQIPVIAGGMEPAYFHNSANRNGKTITISGSGANAGYVSFHRKPIFASDCSTITENKKYCIEFIFYALQNIQQEIYAEQTGGAQPHIYPSNLSSMQISISHDLIEQKAIAEILSDMDAEIAALEERLEKAKAIKQGMMQQLLTGKIRLVEPQTSQEVSA